MPLIVKIKYGTEIRRFTLQDPISYNVLCRTLTELFPHNNVTFSDSYTIKYYDDEGDLVSIETDEELHEASRLARSHSNVLRLELFVKRDHAKTNPSRPIREETVEKSVSWSELDNSLTPLTDSIKCSSIYASQLPVLPTTLKRAASNEPKSAPEPKKQRIEEPLTASRRGALTHSCALMSSQIKDECSELSSRTASDCNTAAQLISSQCRVTSEQMASAMRGHESTAHLAQSTSEHCQQLSDEISKQCEQAVSATSQLSRAESDSTSQSTQELSNQIARLMLGAQPEDVQQAQLVKQLSSQTKADCLKHADSIVATIMAL